MLQASVCDGCSLDAFLRGLCRLCRRLPTSARRASGEGITARCWDRRPPARRAWPLARQFLPDAWCTPHQLRSEGQAPPARADGLPLQFRQARNLGKGLVNGNSFHERREIADHLDGGVAQSLVFRKIPLTKAICGQGRGLARQQASRPYHVSSPLHVVQPRLLHRFQQKPFRFRACARWRLTFFSTQSLM